MSRIISFPQAFALHKGANYRFKAVFTGLPTSTLTADAGFKFNQPAFQTPAANLYNSATTTYALGTSASSASAGLVYKFGGNLVDTAIKWTNGKSIGNWYQIQRHAAGTPTGGSVTSDGRVLRITCGSNTTGINRSLIHDVRFNRAGVLVTESSGTVTGYLQDGDTMTTKVYFKGYVEPFDFLAPTGLGTVLGKHTIFFVGYRYFHTQVVDQMALSTPLDTFAGDSEGFGFQPIRNGSTFNWHCIVVASAEVTTGTVGICFAVDTGISAFTPCKLQVNYTNNTLTWFANDIQVATTSFTALIAAGNIFNSINSMYACVVSIKGGNTTIPAGGFTICVQEAAVIRELPHTFNNFEDTDTEVTATDTDYQTTGLHLLKKLK